MGREEVAAKGTRGNSLEMGYNLKKEKRSVSLSSYQGESPVLSSSQPYKQGLLF